MRSNGKSSKPAFTVVLKGTECTFLSVYGSPNHTCDTCNSNARTYKIIAVCHEIVCEVLYVDVYVLSERFVQCQQLEIERPCYHAAHISVLLEYLSPLPHYHTYYHICHYFHYSRP